MYDDEDRLHPNLARLAAEFDQIVEDWNRGLLEVNDATEKIDSLSALDDNGVRWRLSPQAEWERMNTSGAWIPDEPPKHGMRSVSPHDISGKLGAFNPDLYVDHGRATRADLEEGEGSTWAPAKRVFSSNDPKTFGSKELPSIKTVLAALAIAAIAALLVTGISGGFTSSDDSQPGPQPVETLPINPVN